MVRGVGDPFRSLDGVDQQHGPRHGADAARDRRDPAGHLANAVEVYVHRLRKMLADSGATVKIHTVRGVGYLMAEEKAPMYNG